MKTKLLTIDAVKPEMETLEFLGSFDDKDTGWIDPLELEAMAMEKGAAEE